MTGDARWDAARALWVADTDAGEVTLGVEITWDRPRAWTTPPRVTRSVITMCGRPLSYRQAEMVERVLREYRAAIDRVWPAPR